MNRQSHSLKQGFLFGLLAIVFMACLVGDSYAQRRGGWGGGSGYSAPVYRPAPPRPAMPSQITPQGPRGGASIGGRPTPDFNRAATTVRPLPPSIKPDSSVARIPSYTGRITTKGAPILVSRTGRTYSVPQQGVFSTRITTTYQTIKTTLVKRLGSGKVAVLQERIDKVATGKKVAVIQPNTRSVGAALSPRANPPLADHLYKDAKTRYPDQWKQYSKLSSNGLVKAINSHNKQIAIHEEAMKNPRAKAKNWDNDDPRHREATLQGWKKDIARHEAYREIADGILREREKNER